MVYLAALVLILIPFFKFDILKKGGNEKLWYYICLSALTLIAGLRYRVGGDTLGYMVHFETYPTIAELSEFDFKGAYYTPLWYVYNAIFKSLGDSFYVFQIVQAFLVNLAFFRFFKRYSKRFFAVLLVYFVGYYLYYNTEILRSALCVVLFLEAYPLLEKRKYHWYFLLSLIAVGFHISAVFLFVIPLFRLIKKENFTVCLVTGLVILVMASLVNVKSIIESVNIPTNSGFRYYLMSRLDSYAKGMPQLSKYYLFDQLAICAPVLGIMLLRRILRFENDSRFGVMAMIMVIIQFASIFHHVIGRFNDYLVPFVIVYLVNTLFENKGEIAANKFGLALATLSFVSFFGVTAVKYCRNQYAIMKGAHIYDRYLPYRSVFNPEKSVKRELLIASQYSASKVEVGDERVGLEFEENEIKEDIYWVNDTVLQDSYVVERGCRLTVKDCYVRVSPDCAVIVRKGAVLVVDNAVIDTDTTHCVRQWRGIQVQGSNLTHQFEIDGTYQQGYIELHNAAIKNAIIGVDLGDPDDWVKKGGIIYAENTSFINNTRAIHAENYTNTDPNTTRPADYNAIFDNCIFEINESYIGTDMFHKHVDLYETHGLKFYGCQLLQTVRNEKTSEYSVGFEANDSDFTIDNSRDGKETRSVFSGFHRGIAANSMRFGNWNNIKVFNAVFKDNSIGVELKDSRTAIIMSNDFFIDNSNDMCTGIMIDGLTDIMIEDNTFTGLNRKHENTSSAVSSTYMKEVHLENNVFNDVTEFDYRGH